jgi:hypothetical protein
MAEFRVAGIVHIDLCLSDAESRVPPAEHSGPKSGERSNPFTLRTPEWKPAGHARLLIALFPARGSLAEMNRVSGSWRRFT